MFMNRSIPCSKTISVYTCLYIVQFAFKFNCAILTPIGLVGFYFVLHFFKVFCFVFD